MRKPLTDEQKKIAVQKAKEWREKNPEKYAALQKKYRDRNREKLNSDAREKLKDPEYRKMVGSRVKNYYDKFPWARKLALIRYRCTNENDISYQWYGGKGIKCLITKEELGELWVRDRAYAMARPSIDRIDSTGHYEMSNCRFIELKENCRDGGKRRHAGLTDL